jgi:hypothetical protein
MCMLVIGELAVRRVSKFEAQGTKLNFGVTSRIQVSCGHQPLSCALRVFISTVASYRDLHVQHRGFRGEPPRQAWASVSQSSSRVDNLRCVSIRPTFTPARTS